MDAGVTGTADTVVLVDRVLHQLLRSRGHREFSVSLDDGTGAPVQAILIRVDAGPGRPTWLLIPRSW
jgi:hypothetical protein